MFLLTSGSRLLVEVRIVQNGFAVCSSGGWQELTLNTAPLMRSISLSILLENDFLLYPVFPCFDTGNEERL